MRKRIFRLLAYLNRLILPKYSKRDLNRLSGLDRAIISYRYYVTKNSLD